MGDCNHGTYERALSVQDGVAVVFHKVGSHDENGSRERHDGEAERIHLRSNCVYDDEEDLGDAGTDEDARGRENSLEGSDEKMLCPPAFCVRGKPASPRGPEKPNTCPGLGLFYAFLATVFFSIISLMVKTIEEIHPIEISAIRCFFQMLFCAPLLIYHKTGFLGPRDKRLFLVLRGVTGSSSMILLFYAVHQMPLADATVVMFSNPVFTSLLAWIFLKEKCSIWDCVFTVFTLTGVVLIARPAFLFGEHSYGTEGKYTNHIKGAIAAFAGAIGAACTFVILRKLGKSIHYYLSVWYYASLGFIMSVITVSVLGEWKLPFCGRSRWMLMSIAILGVAGQTFLIKALQIEKAGPVALMRTMEVVLAFIFQFIFFNHVPTWWSLGGALCIVVSTSGVAVRKWYSYSRKS